MRPQPNLGITEIQALLQAWGGYFPPLNKVATCLQRGQKHVYKNKLGKCLRKEPYPVAWISRHGQALMLLMKYQSSPLGTPRVGAPRALMNKEYVAIPRAELWHPRG